MPPFLRVAREGDAAALAAIYGYYATQTVITFNTEPPTAQEYIEKIRHLTPMYPFLVLEENGLLLGFAYADRMRPHDAYLWDVELTIYLSPDAPKRNGYGSQLFVALLHVLTRQGFTSAYSVITYPNQPSIGLHRAFGFTEVGHFPKAGFKQGRWLDIVWLYKPLANSAAQPEPPLPFAQLSDEELNKLLQNQ